MQTKKTLKTVLLLMLVFVLALSMASCGGKDSKETSSEGVSDRDLVISTYSAGHCYLDPHQTTAYDDYVMMNQVYDTLVTADFDGTTIVDSLAKSWEVSNDGLVYTFHLKDGIKFHSGKPLTAEDVKWTYDRWKDPANAALTRSFVQYVDKIEAIDAKTVKITLTQPDNNFLINLTVPVASILNKDAVEAAEAKGEVYGTDTVDGTGPFKFVEYVENDSIKMTRFDDYTWGPSCFKNQGPAKVAGLVIRCLPEAGTRVMEFQAGNIDILGNGCMFGSELSSLDNIKFAKVLDFVPPYPVFIQFQLDHVTDLAVRQACNIAIDRDEIVSTVMGGKADQMVGALPASYAPWYWDGAEGYYKHDINAANALLDENGYKLSDDGYRYKDGKQLTIDIMFCSSDEDAKTANLFQAQMKKIGVNVTVNTSMVSNFWSHINTNEFDTLIMGLYLNTPEDMLNEYMNSKNRPFPNRQGFSDPRVDELLATARSTLDEQTRIGCYNEIQKVAMEQAMWIPLYNRNGFLVINDRVKDLKPHPTIAEGEPKYLDCYIEE